MSSLNQIQPINCQASLLILKLFTKDAFSFASQITSICLISCIKSQILFLSCSHFFHFKHTGNTSTTTSKEKESGRKEKKEHKERDNENIFVQPTTALKPRTLSKFSYHQSFLSFVCSVPHALLFVIGFNLS